MRSAPPVAIIMGSQSDWPTMRHAAETLDALKVDYEARIVSAPTDPDERDALRRRLIDDEAVTPVAWLSSGGSVEEVAGLVAGLTY